MDTLNLLFLREETLHQRKQGVLREWLLQKLPAQPRQVIRIDGLTSPAGHEEHWHSGVRLVYPEGELRARQVGQPDIEDGELRDAAVLEVREGIDRRVGGEAVVARQLEHATGDTLDHGVVIHHENERGHGGEHLPDLGLELTPA